jgi:hypothetical protein
VIVFGFGSVSSGISEAWAATATNQARREPGTSVEPARDGTLILRW